MLNVTMNVTDISYEETATNLLIRYLPRMPEKIAENTVVRLLNKLGGQAPAVLCTLMRYVPDDGKIRLICELMNRNQEKLADLINDVLASHEFGKNFHISGIMCKPDNRGMSLSIHDLKVSYDGLLDNELVKGAVHQMASDYVGDNPLMKNRSLKGLGSVLAQNAYSVAKFAVKLPFVNHQIEKSAVAIIQNPNNKAKIVSLLEQAFVEAGLVMRIQNFDVLPSPPVENAVTLLPDSEAAGKDGQTVPELEPLNAEIFSSELEDMLLNAIAQFLKDSVQT